MKEEIRLIEKIILLSSLPREEIASYLKDGSFRLKTYGKNSIVHFSGEICSKLEIILTGRVSVERIDEDGNLLSIADFHSDDIIGGNLLFSKNPIYPMTITAKENSFILEIERERLFALFSKDPSLLRNYLEFISDHAAILGDRIQSYVNKTIRECIISYLEYEEKRQGTHRIRLPITKKAWAEKIGVQRTSLSRELAKMRREGLVQYDAEFIELL